MYEQQLRRNLNARTKLRIALRNKKNLATARKNVLKEGYRLALITSIAPATKSTRSPIKNRIEVGTYQRKKPRKLKTGKIIRRTNSVIRKSKPRNIFFGE